MCEYFSALIKVQDPDSAEFIFSAIRNSGSISKEIRELVKLHNRKHKDYGKYITTERLPGYEKAMSAGIIYKIPIGGEIIRFSRTWFSANAYIPVNFISLEGGIRIYIKNMNEITKIINLGFIRYKLQFKDV